MKNSPPLREVYRARLPIHLKALRAAIADACGGSAEGVETIRRLAHDLKGTGASFGFPEITQAARCIGQSGAINLSEAERLLDTVLRCSLMGPGLSTSILIVGNQAEFAPLITEALAAPGRRILMAESSHQATEILAEESVDLVLIDLVLPDEDGRRLLSRLRRMSHTMHLPLFVVAPPLGPETQTECYALGADGFFEKPLDGSVVGAVVTARLARTSATDAPAPSTDALSHRASEKLGRAGGIADVWIIEDDELTVEVLRHRLERDGFRVRSASDGIDAMELAAGGPPSLVILDVKLPGLDGFSVLARLRAMEGWGKIPIVMLTALGAEADLVKAFSLGATDYVVKPFSPGEVTARVRRLVAP